MEKYILALDQGTTSSRAIRFNRGGRLCTLHSRNSLNTSQTGLLREQNANEIWSSILAVMASCLAESGIKPTIRRMKKCKGEVRVHCQARPGCHRTQPEVFR